MMLSFLWLWTAVSMLLVAIDADPTIVVGSTINSSIFLAAHHIIEAMRGAKR